MSGGEGLAGDSVEKNLTTCVECEHCGDLDPVMGEKVCNLLNYEIPLRIASSTIAYFCPLGRGIELVVASDSPVERLMDAKADPNV